LGPDATGEAAQALLLQLFKDRARRFGFRLEEAFQAEQAKGEGTFDDAFNRVQNLGYKAAECHNWWILTRNMWEQVALLENGPVKDVLLKVFELTLLQQVWENIGDFSKVLDDAVVDQLLLQRVNKKLAEIRPDMIGLTDGFALTDSQLNSTIGDYSGNVYEKIYETARMSPLNQAEVMVGWEHLKTVVDLDFIKEGKEEQRQGATAPPRAGVAPPAQGSSSASGAVSASKL